MQATAVEIETATTADIPLLLALIRELAEYEKLCHQVVATEDLLRLALFSSLPVAHALVARVGGEPAGFALYFLNFSTFLAKPGLYLEDLFVRPAFRGRAVGKRLLAHLAKLAVERDYGRFEWAVLDWNLPARRFYEALGAQANSPWINYRITGEALRRLAAAGDSAALSDGAAASDGAVVSVL
ncbi:MAG: N-acetyltransferase family protein [Steroidobacteraceae bacterium]|jgi:GNAT superfamily N-acetyltransferase